jgi:hypothetical protein
MKILRLAILISGMIFLGSAYASLVEAPPYKSEVTPAACVPQCDEGKSCDAAGHRAGHRKEVCDKNCQQERVIKQNTIRSSNCR